MLNGLLHRCIQSFDKEAEFPPQFTMRLRDRRVQFSYPVRLTCQVFGNPQPKITWKKDGQTLCDNGTTKTILPAGSNRNLIVHCSLWSEDHFHTLEVNNARSEDAGLYSIVAENPLGSVSCSCTLIVDQGLRHYTAPSFAIPLEPEVNELNEGQELRIGGRISAYPAVGVVWYRDKVMDLFEDNDGC